MLTLAAMSSALPDRLSVSDRFRVFAARSSDRLGSPWAFVMAVVIVVVWLVTGPLFKFSNAWQLVINTGTTIVTFLMVFLIQATQNRDTEAIQIKLDEIIRAISGASNALLDLEDLEEEDLVKMRERYLHLAERARRVIDRDEGVNRS